eukprot:gene12063-biopygen10961
MHKGRVWEILTLTLPHGLILSWGRYPAAALRPPRTVARSTLERGLSEHVRLGMGEQHACDPSRHCRRIMTAFDWCV